MKVLEGDTTRAFRRPTATLCSTSGPSSSSSATASASSATSPPAAPAGRRAHHAPKSDELDTAQNLTQLLKIVANWIWIPALLAWAVALWLVPGRRRKEVRAIGIGLIVAGVALLVIRRSPARTSSTTSPSSDSVAPGGRRFLDDPLRRPRRGAHGSSSVIGVIGGARRVDHRARARARRRRPERLGPSLANAGLAWAVFAAVLLVVVWALPLHRFLTTAILIVLAAIGFEIARRQIVREYEAEGPAPPRDGPRCPWRKPAPAPAPSRSRSSSASRSCARTTSSPRTSTRRRRVGSCRRPGT